MSVLRGRSAGVLLGLALLAGCASTPSAPSSPGSRPDAGAAAEVPPPPALRIPTDVRPTAEHLSLRLDPRGSSFAGTARIQLTVAAPVTVFWLHAQDLTLRRATLSQGGAAQPVRTATVPPDWLAVLPATRFIPGPAELVLDYEGALDRERSRGAYRVDEGDRSYLYTFFEPVDARRAFPCFDEPSFKIPWELEIAVPPGNGAFANGAEASRETGTDGWVHVRFERTRPLPSYLVAFAAGPFDVVPGAPAGHHGTPLRIVVPPGHREELGYALSILPRIIQLLEDATEVPYPYGKLDVLVVPRFWGTMEHPGLVALGQPLMLLPPHDEALARRQHGANIAVHELAHYWYGDLVTTAWWDDTWLNESFGSWMASKVTGRLEPGWRWSRKAIGTRLEGLEADALPGAKRIRQPVRVREDIDASFDAALTYSKGQMVLRMFESWVGEAAWRSALATYLRTYSDRNATSGDLFRSLDGALARDVSASLETFVDQPGFPLVRASLRCTGGDPAVLQLTQEPFLEGSKPRTWGIPVCVRAGSGRRVERACTLLSGSRGTLELSAALGCPDWTLVNDGGLGYYRVAYAPELRTRLGRIPARALSAEEQISISFDLSAVAERGEVPLGEVLDRGVAMARSADPDVSAHGWQLLSTWLRKDRLTPGGRSGRVELFRALGSARARTLGWKGRPGESLDRRELRPQLLLWVALDGEDRALQSEADRLSRAWLDDGRGLDEDMIEAALAVSAASGNAALFDRMLAGALAARSHLERDRIVKALGWFEDPALAARARALLEDTRFDLRETGGMLGVQLARSETRPGAWPYLREHAGALVPRMRDDEAKWMITSIGAACDLQLAEQAANTLEPVVQRLDGGPFAFRQALDRVRRCAAIHDRTDAAAEAWLSRRGAAGAARR